MIFFIGNVQFFQHTHDWELEVTHFFALLYSQKIRCGGEDKICWILSKRNNFEVKSYYKSLFTPTQAFAPWKSIWKVKAPSRVAFCVDSDKRKDPHFGQFTNEECYGNGVVLYV
jgi:hypothetical protein